MKEVINLITKALGLSGLNVWQTRLLIWFCMSLMALTMNEDAPSLAWFIVFANLITSSLLVKKYIKLNPKED